VVDEDLIPRHVANHDSSAYSERLLQRWADCRSPAARQTTPQTGTPDEEGRAARG
jgi:hypothetical protein